MFLHEPELLNILVFGLGIATPKNYTKEMNLLFEVQLKGSETPPPPRPHLPSPTRPIVFPNKEKTVGGLSMFHSKFLYGPITIPDRIIVQRVN